MIDVGIQETTATTGTGTLTLTAATGFVRVSDSFEVGDVVSTCITSGNGDKEWGLCHVGAGGTLERVMINATLVGSVFSRANVKIALSGVSTVVVTQNTATSTGGWPILNTGIAVNQCPYLGGGALGDANFSVIPRYAIPWSVSTPITWDALGFSVSIAGAGVAAAAIAANKIDANGQCRVARQLFYTGDLSTNTTGDKLITITDFSPVPGRIYWTLFWNDTSARLRSCNGRGAFGSPQGGSPFPLACFGLPGYSAMPLPDYSEYPVGTPSAGLPYVFFRPKI